MGGVGGGWGKERGTEERKVGGGEGRVKGREGAE